MTQLTIRLGQSSSAGCKEINQDSFGAMIPNSPDLELKGIAIALSDGVSSSQVSQIASETAIKSFLSDYYCTSEAWSVSHAARQVLKSTNAWLYNQNQQGPYQSNIEKGYVCTFSALILKKRHAHIVHVGDSRIYHLRNGQVSVLTQDHRINNGNTSSYLSRALGAEGQIHIDYQHLEIKENDIFILMTDGVSDYMNATTIQDIIRNLPDHLEDCARGFVQHALDSGSQDNLTVQIVKIDSVDDSNQHVLLDQPLPIRPILEVGQEFDGYKIIRNIHSSSRSHVYLAVDMSNKQQVVIKTPSINYSNDDAYLERLMLEEWVAKRISNPHVISIPQMNRARHYWYTISEFVQGQTLAQWLRDHPQPSLTQIRNIIQQIAKGLMALHRNDILHQDLRPENIMIDDNCTVKIIDLGAVRIAGITEFEEDQLLGTAIFTAPEYFIGAGASENADLYSLAVLTYYMLSGRYPYGLNAAKARTLSAQYKLQYQTVVDPKRDLPIWLDATLKKALHPNPVKRYQLLSEFIYDLHHPNPAFLAKLNPPWIERNPLRFWQSLCVLLSILLITALIHI
ncbi:bifunctional protein-serine/threonine kinase/phosphatase [Vibrio gangliei]|uniref:bifunctional protein-serine/threonine kinase/phosphatase n=1 Tax=Vibrio gangliei TaxID=2077090 RepID=UPI000D014C70|nr:bifunctional protein-serine/threonine kinase/phosphatase [Vibrio gangliei]